MRGISGRACGLLSFCFPYLFVEKLITNLRHEMQPSKLRFHMKNFGDSLAERHCMFFEHNCWNFNAQISFEACLDWEVFESQKACSSISRCSRVWTFGPVLLCVAECSEHVLCFTEFPWLEAVCTSTLYNAWIPISFCSSASLCV